MSEHPDPWVIDPDALRAPPQEIWDRMTDEQRQHVVDNLPAARDLIVKLEGIAGELEQRLLVAGERAAEESRRAEEQARRAEAQARRAEEQARCAQEQALLAEGEARRAEAAKRRLREAVAELERLRLSPH